GEGRRTPESAQAPDLIRPRISLDFRPFGGEVEDRPYRPAVCRGRHLLIRPRGVPDPWTRRSGPRSTPGEGGAGRIVTAQWHLDRPRSSCEPDPPTVAVPSHLPSEGLSCPVTALSRTRSRP